MQIYSLPTHLPQVTPYSFDWLTRIAAWRFRDPMRHAASTPTQLSDAILRDIGLDRMTVQYEAHDVRELSPAGKVV